MKKNMLAILILAATLVNMILTAVCVFVVVPVNKKTNDVMIKVLQMIDMEVVNPITTVIYDKTVSAADTDSYPINAETAMNITLKKESDSKQNILSLQASLSLNIKDKNYKNVLEQLPKNEDRIKEIISNVVGQYTYSTVDENKEAIKEQIIAEIKAIFGNDCIYSISFSSFMPIK